MSGTFARLTVALVPALCSIALAAGGLISLDTRDTTIMKVRTALRQGQSFIVASSYHGTLLGLSFDGRRLWQNPLSGYMNHDLWCEDITGDGNDEILAANADGTVYCLDAAGRIQWSFRANSAPMYAVCSVRQNGVSYVVCGGLDRRIYYLSNSGEQIKRIASATYSVGKAWGRGPKRIPPKGMHTTNFLRPVRLASGKEKLAVHGVINTNASVGDLYIFEVLSDRPERIIKLVGKSPFGDMRVRDMDGDGIDEILFGSSSMIQDSACLTVRPERDEKHLYAFGKWGNPLLREIDRFGYRVLQPEIVTTDGQLRAMLLFGSRIILLDPAMQHPEEAEVLACRYAFNDMWRDPTSGRIILASAQSGGSCVHILDLSTAGWKQTYQDLSPPGKIAAIFTNTDAVRMQLARFTKPSWERAPLPVVFMTDSIPEALVSLVQGIHGNYDSPVFLKGKHLPHVENWDRSHMTSEKYRKRRDRRKKYTKTSDEILGILKPLLDANPGIAYWGGHGNDPYQISLATQKRIIAAAAGKHVVMIYPELEDASGEFGYVLNDLIIPLAEYCRGTNAKIYLRNKHLFWQSSVYKPMWHRFLSGEFADTIVPSMEETTDKTMELSLAARQGLWASGVVDQWGGRCARDNPSYDRLRQHSHQMLPNHFLRYQIYNIASGAQYMNNFAVDQEYMSVLWDLIAKGALYVPKREEIVSFSPVHLSMTDPDGHYEDDANNVKWTLFYDEVFDRENPFVFSRLNGSWPGAPVTEWDFSRYAAGVRERRLNFLPPYANGLVLITPKQAGRKKTLTDLLHPLYRNILKEYVTDGRHYYSPDSRKTYAADTYYSTIAEDIADSAKLLPLTVSGDVAWVCAQTAPKHLRLTLVDSGYINPSAKTATITFHTVTPIAVTDVLTAKPVTIGDGNTTRVYVPCGVFRFLDIQIKEAL